MGHLCVAGTRRTWVTTKLADTAFELRGELTWTLRTMIRGYQGIHTLEEVISSQPDGQS
jgi:hypothetical protein